MKKLLTLLAVLLIGVTAAADTICGINLDEYYLVDNPGPGVLVEKFIDTMDAGYIPFVNDQAKKVVKNKLSAIMHMAKTGKYNGAIKMLEKDVIPKLNNVLTEYKGYLTDVLRMQVEIFEHPDSYVLVGIYLENNLLINETTVCGLQIPEWWHISDADDCKKVGKMHFSGCDMVTIVPAKPTTKQSFIDDLYTSPY